MCVCVRDPPELAFAAGQSRIHSVPLPSEGGGPEQQYRRCVCVCWSCISCLCLWCISKITLCVYTEDQRDQVLEYNLLVTSMIEMAVVYR